MALLDGRRPDRDPVGRVLHGPHARARAACRTRCTRSRPTRRRSSTRRPARSSSGSRRRRTRGSTSSTSAPSPSASDAILVVDNTLATPLGQRPLELGADYVDGERDEGGSAVTATSCSATSRRADVDAGRGAARSKLGTIAGPFEVWLAHRSLATLDVRLERECANALAAGGGDRRARAGALPRAARRPGARDGEAADGPLRAGAVLHAARRRGRATRSSRAPSW